MYKKNNKLGINIIFLALIGISVFYIFKQPTIEGACWLPKPDGNDVPTLFSKTDCPEMNQDIIRAITDTTSPYWNNWMKALALAYLSENKLARGMNYPVISILAGERNQSEVDYRKTIQDVAAATVPAAKPAVPAAPATK
jgi:hypothetical protein